MDKNESIQEDIELVRQIAAGSKAEESLYQKYYEKILFFARRKIGNLEDAKDIYQETMLAVILAARKNIIKNSEKLSSFIYAICNKKVFDMIRQKYRSPKIPLEKLINQLDNSATFSSDDIEKLDEELDIFIISKNLDLEERVIFRLTLFWKWRSWEIGKLIDISDDLVRKKKERILKKRIKI